MLPETTAPSPCINVCIMDNLTGWCTGCFRTMDEIVAWGVAANVDKWAVLAALPQRETAFFAHNGAKAATVLPCTMTGTALL